MITLTSIGVAVRQFHDCPLKFNFIQREDGDDSALDDVDYPRIVIGNSEVELNPNFMKKFSALVAIAILLPLAFLYVIIDKVCCTSANNELSQVEVQVNQNQAKVEEYKKINKNVTFDIYNVITSNIEKNKKKLGNFRALEYSIPKDLWITYFETDSEARVDIKGTTGDTKNVYLFYKNLKQIVNDSNVMLRRLELSENALDTMALSNAYGKRYYQFEITDMPISQTASMSSIVENNSSPEAKSRSLFELGQPWLPVANDNNGQAKNPDAPLVNPETSNQPGLPENLQKIENFH